MGGGNPLKKVAKTVTKAVKQTGSEISRTPSNIDSLGRGIEQAGKDLTDLDWYNKVATASAAALSDPGAWMTAFASGGMSFLKSGKDAWEAMSDAEKAEARAKVDAELAARKEKQALVAQEKMVSDKAKAAAAIAKERAARLGTGRRGLLYQGKETGVTNKSNVLGG